MDMMVIVQALLLQDVPFFCLRMTLICHFQVISHMNIFFTCKNTMIILLQLYRLLILIMARRPIHRRQSRIFSVIQNPYDPSSAMPDIQEQDEANKEASLAVLFIDTRSLWGSSIYHVNS